ncbi:MAG: hypothetical protein ACYCYM_11210 [Saccharofermentanales bacterium]
MNPSDDSRPGNRINRINRINGIKWIKDGIAILLISMIAASAILATFAYALELTVFNPKLYAGIAATPEYGVMVKNAINKDLSEQSSYVGIDFGYMTAGLDDGLLQTQIGSYYGSLSSFMDGTDTFTRSMYPADKFYQQLTLFIDTAADKNGYIPSEEQYALLRTVSEDSAKIVDRHVNLLDPGNDLTGRLMDRFQPAAHAFAGSGALFAICTLILAIVLIILERRRMAAGFRLLATALWIAGVLIAVPAIVLDMFRITSRISIGTAYIKFAADTVLTAVNHHIILIGLAVLIGATAIKISLFILAARAVSASRKAIPNVTEN